MPASMKKIDSYRPFWGCSERTDVDVQALSSLEYSDCHLLRRLTLTSMMRTRRPCTQYSMRQCATQTHSLGVIEDRSITKVGVSVQV